MILPIIRWMLGSTGSAIIDFIAQNPLLFNLFAVIFLLILGAGHFQLWLIKNKTKNLVLLTKESMLQNNDKSAPIDVYEKALPVWQQSLKKWALFIPHKLEFYPVLVNEKNVREKFNFSSQWIETILFENKK